MREFLFRGKRCDNGEWVEGSLIMWEDGSCSIDNGRLDTPQLAALPDTVGQYTGLTDRNGKKIFEWDIVLCSKWELGLKPMQGYVTFEDGCFCVQDTASTNKPAIDLCSCIEVIGNIHDNPDLVKEGDDG